MDEVMKNLKRRSRQTRQRMLFDVGFEIYTHHQTFSDTVVHATEFDRR